MYINLHLKIIKVKKIELFTETICVENSFIKYNHNFC